MAEAEIKTTKKVVKEEPIVEEEKMVTIILPRLRDDDESSVFVTVNEKQYLIERGVRVTVPESVAMIIRNSEEMEYMAAKKRAKVSKEI